MTHSRVSPRVKLREGRHELVRVFCDCPRRVAFAEQSTATRLHSFHFCQCLLTLCFCQSCACVAQPSTLHLRVKAWQRGLRFKYTVAQSECTVGMMPAAGTTLATQLASGASRSMDDTHRVSTQVVAPRPCRAALSHPGRYSRRAAVSNSRACALPGP